MNDKRPSSLHEQSWGNIFAKKESESESAQGGGCIPACTGADTPWCPRWVCIQACTGADTAWCPRGGGCVSQHALGQTPPGVHGGCVSQHALGQTPPGVHGGVYPSMHWGRHPLVSTGGVCIPACTGADNPPPRGQNSWHTLVKTLPLRNFVCER